MVHKRYIGPGIGLTARRSLAGLFWVLVLVVSWAAPVAGAFAQEESVADRLQRIQEQELDSLQQELDRVAADRGEDHADLLPILWAIADVYGGHGAYIAATPVMERALAITEAVHGRDSVNTLSAVDNMARVYRLQGDYVRARLLDERFVSTVETDLGVDVAGFGYALTGLGETLLRNGDIADATDQLERALQILSSTLGALAHEVTLTQLLLAEAHLRAGKVRRPEALLEFGLAVRSEALTFGNSESEARIYMAPFMSLLGALYSAAGLYGKAEEPLKEALLAYEAGVSPSHPSLESVLVNLTALYERNGESETARQYRARADQLRRENIGFAFVEGAPAYEAPDVIPVASDPNGLFREVMVGDWVIYEIGGEPHQKLEIVELTPSVVVIGSYEGNPEEGGWARGSEQAVRRDISLEEYYGIPSPRPARCELGDADIACLLFEVTSETGETDSMYFAPDVIPVGGMLAEKYSFRETPNRVMQYRRRGEEVIVSRAVVKRTHEERAGDVDFPDENGKTALHHAAQEGRLNEARDLVERGADVNRKATMGDTPLHLAANRGQAAVVRLLVQNGADVNAHSRSGIYGQRGTALQGAVRRQDLELAAFLIENGADVNAANKRRETALHIAFPKAGSTNASSELLTLLLEQGADPNAADWTGETPLHVAAGRATAGQVRLLIAHGADIEARTQGGGGGAARRNAHIPGRLRNHRSPARGRRGSQQPRC